MPPRVTVIIPAYQARGRLLHCLAALSRQTCPAAQFEVIVADDGSSDGTSAAVRRLSVPYRLEVVRLPENRGRAAARNAGIQAAAGELLVFLDADMLAPPEFLSRHLACHAGWRDRVVVAPTAWHMTFTFVHGGMNRRQRWAVLTLARRHPGFARRLPGGWERVNSHQPVLTPADVAAGRYREYALPSGLFGPVVRQHGPELAGFRLPWLLGCTGNMSVARRAVAGAGGFCPEFRGWGLEDQELAYRLHRAGLVFHNASDIAVYHQEHLVSPHRADEARAGARVWLRRHPDLASHLFFALRRPLLASRVLDQFHRLLAGADPPTALLELLCWLLRAHCQGWLEDRPVGPGGWRSWASRLGSERVAAAAAQYQDLRRRPGALAPGRPDCHDLLAVVEQLVHRQPG